MQMVVAAVWMLLQSPSADCVIHCSVFVCFRSRQEVSMFALLLKGKEYQYHDLLVDSQCLLEPVVNPESALVA